MDKHEYDAALNQIFLFARLARGVEGVDEVLKKINSADAVGWVFDPTGYRAAMPRLEVIKKVVEAFAKFQSSLPSEEECLKADQKTEALKKFSGI